MKRSYARTTLTAAVAGLLLSSLSVAEPLRFAASAYLAPYIDSETDSGPHLAIVREALAYAGYELAPTIYTSNKRAVLLLRSGKVEGAINVPRDIGELIYSDPVIYYQNRAISRSNEQLSIASIEDLLHHRVVGFQSAEQFLGTEYQDAMQRHPNYREVANQQSQVELLLRGRTDVVVMDLNIFHHIQKTMEPSLRAVEVVGHALFPETPHFVSFTDSTLQQAFNRGLQHLISTGRYSELIAPLKGEPAGPVSVSPASQETGH